MCVFKHAWVSSIVYRVELFMFPALRGLLRSSLLLLVSSQSPRGNTVARTCRFRNVKRPGAPLAARETQMHASNDLTPASSLSLIQPQSLP